MASPIRPSGTAHSASVPSPTGSYGGQAAAIANPGVGTIAKALSAASPLINANSTRSARGMTGASGFSTAVATPPSGEAKSAVNTAEIAMS